jgi:hypothetical protein
MCFTESQLLLDYLRMFGLGVFFTLMVVCCYPKKKATKTASE